MKHAPFLLAIGVTLVAVVGGGSVALAAEPDSKAAAFFEARIRPLLVRRCLKCHGGEKTSHKLRVDSRAAIVGGGQSGPAIVAGRPDDSLLIQAVRYGEDSLQMPPGGKLPQEEIALLERWVKLGAPWPDAPKKRVAGDAMHWSFRPIRPVEPPVDDSGWAENPIDAFVLTGLREQRLAPVELAAPRTLIRRVYFDLIGLPPLWEEVAAFADDPSPAAYERLIARLLDSPQYGERWGRHWLDLARYSDTQGGSVDCPIPQARLYRDYVIDSFCADKPYDEFIQEQIAGDLMVARVGESLQDCQPVSQRPDSAERTIATGFLGLSIRNGIFKHYHPELIIEDTMDTIGRSILGMTIRCARCHDHKFEPISTADYYRLYGIFASSRFPFSGSELPQFSAGETVPLISPQQWAAIPNEQREAIEQLRARIADERAKHPAQKELQEKQERLARDVRRYHEIRSQGKFDVALRTSIDDQDIRIREVVAKLDTSVRKLWNELKAAERAAGIERAYAMRDESPSDARIQVAGDPFDAGRLVRRGVPERLVGDSQLQIPEGESGRLQLARWLTSPDNPLTPRVAVNYIWQFHFGKGIVATPDNFGLGGAAPTHPELLDWLAREFIDNGWSVKHLHRLILTSKTYRLASRADESGLAVDPTNRWYWRFDRRRLDAESLRDGIMQVAGTLDVARPGPHPFPAESAWQFSQHGPFKAVYDSPHRSVYLMTQRLQRHPFLTLFDGPDTSRPTPRRRSTAKALQALYLRNSPFIHQQSEALARRLIESADDPARRVEMAVRRVWSREPASEEVDDALNYIDRYAAQWRQDRSSDAGAKPELVLEYKFDGDAKDTSGRDRHGTLVGDPQFTDGHLGQCISLDGDGDYIDCGVTMNLGSSFAVECWVRPGPNQARYADIFGNHLGGSSRGFVLQQNGDATNQFRGSFGAGGETWVLTEPVALKTGAWQQVALVRTPSALRLFLNGKQQAEVASTAAVQPSELALRVGLGITLVDRCFLGEIDELRVYRGVPQHYREQLTPKQIELAAWSSYARLVLTANEFLYVD
jgi:hypothetical protein